MRNPSTGLLKNPIVFLDVRPFRPDSVVHRAMRERKPNVAGQLRVKFREILTSPPTSTQRKIAVLRSALFPDGSARTSSRIIHSQKINLFVGLESNKIGKVDSLKITASLYQFAATGVIHQDSSHGFSGSPKK